MVSVGLQLDPRVYPEREDLSPEEEFLEIIARFPSIQKQFAQAESVRPWVRTKRLQYSSRQCVGHRWCLLSHAAGFIDPLFSKGLINTSEVNRQLAQALIEAKGNEDFSFARFAHIEGLQRKLFDYADRLANAALITWGNYELWNAWLRVWAIETLSVESALASRLLAFNFPKFYRPPPEDFLFSPFEDPGYAAFFARMENIVLAYERGEHSADEALLLMRRELEANDFAMHLPNGSDSHKWAIKNLDSRDLYIGKPELHERWEKRMGDPALFRSGPRSPST
jgi:FADH2 O2-dependent halogenase